MMEQVTVSLSGPAFSFLLFENVKNKGQEGFLLGQVVERETRSITDNDQEQILITKTIKVNSVLPCPHSYFFYNGVGKVDVAKVKEFLGSQINNVVAWYKYKIIQRLDVSFREKMIHKQLASSLPVSSELFSMCILTSDSTENKSTHTFQQTFVRCPDNKYLNAIPLHIINLSDPQSSYKTSEGSSDTFKALVRSLDMHPKKTQGLTFITKIQQTLHDHVDSLVSELSVAEKKLYDLEQEVKSLVHIQKMNGTQNIEMENDADASTSNVSIRENRSVSPNKRVTLSESPPDNYVNKNRKGRGGRKQSIPKETGDNILLDEHRNNNRLRKINN